MGKKPHLPSPLAWFAAAMAHRPGHAAVERFEHDGVCSRQVGIVPDDDEAVPFVQAEDIDEGLGQWAHVFGRPVPAAVGAFKQYRRAVIAPDAVDDLIAHGPEPAYASYGRTADAAGDVMPGQAAVARV